MSSKFPKTELLQAGPTEQDSALAKVIAQLTSEDSCIKVYRMQPQGKSGKPSYLGTHNPGDFIEPEELIKREYGGGRFLWKAYAESEMVASGEINIEGDPIGSSGTVQRIGQPGQQPSPYSNPAAPTDPIADILRVLTEQNKIIIEKLTAPQQNSITDRLVNAAIENILGGGASKPQTPMSEVLGIIKAVGDMSGQFGGDRPIWYDLVKELKDPLMKVAETVKIAIERQQPRKPKPPIPTQPGQPAISAPNGNGTTPTPSPVPDPAPSNPVVSMIGAYMPMLQQAASDGRDPDEVAESISTFIPDLMLPQVKAWLEKEGCLDELIASYPEIVYTRAWWIQLRTSLYESLNRAQNQEPSDES